MIETLRSNWWLLAICAVLDAMISAVYLVMRSTDGGVLSYSWNGTVVFVGKLAIAAGFCTIAAALVGSRKSWVLALNGLALVAIGAAQQLTRVPISILVFACLVILMAVSLGFLDLAVARAFRLRLRRADSLVFTVAGIVSMAFVLPWLALGFRWIAMEPGSHPDLLWLGSFFGFAAVCTMALAIRLNRTASVG